MTFNVILCVSLCFVSVVTFFLAAVVANSSSHTDALDRQAKDEIAQTTLLVVSLLCLVGATIALTLGDMPL